MEINGFSILMFIFGLALLLLGLYIYKGHDVSKFFMRACYRNLKKDQWINIGKWVMITSIIPFVLAFIGLFLEV